MSVSSSQEIKQIKWWQGGRSPFNLSYGKIMMWFFLLSDSFTFAAFLIAYGAIRFSQPYWPDPNVVFDAFPFMGHAHLPLMFVSLMSFILIMSSVTMVLAVHAGHHMDKNGVVKWLSWTIVGGAAFLLCQAWEWAHLITDKGQTVTGNFWGPYLDPNSPTGFSEGPPLFGSLFFGITGFHGAHVLSGVVINTIVLINVINNKYQKLGHYEMVEKVGLYWHFVDLVWVFVFLCFYLL